MDTFKTLVELCSLPGPSGFEEPAAKYAGNILDKYMDETWTDVLGNVIGVRRCGKDGAKKLLLDAHIDEIGLIVTGVQEGFLRFSTLGGVDSRVLPALGVSVLSEPPVFGVIGVLPPHVLKKEDTEKVLKIEDLFIDIGMQQEEAVKAVPLGTPVVPAQSIRCLGEKGIFGKAVDDRAGFVSILRALHLLDGKKLDIDLYVIASVQEEVGVRGAAPGVFNIAPDWCIVVDAGHAKTPDAKSSEASAEMGGGVMISRGPNMNSKLTEMMLSLACEHEIKYRIDIEPGGDSGTNARAIQVSREGVATGLLSIPVKYMHTPCEAVSLDDIESTAKLICEAILAIGEEY